jgi:pimeloyl-ACP methyl ester carboxylesterase
MTPLKDAHALAKRLQNAEPPLVINDARHAPQFSHPDQVADYIMKAVK